MDDEQLVKQIDEGFGDIEDDNDTPITDALFRPLLHFLHRTDYLSVHFQSTLALLVSVLLFYSV